MPITVQQDSLFKNGFQIKYITGWDQLFRKEKYSGALYFYDGIPSHIVNVDILADRNKLKEEDILITLGEFHNTVDTIRLITEKTDTIFEFCKSNFQGGFVLDLNRMKVVEPSDFSSFIPTRGLGTFFMFENIKDKMYCLVNPTKNIKNVDFYGWFASYIYSYMVCLDARDKIEAYPKKVLQALSTLALSKGKNCIVSNDDSVLSCELNSIGELLLPVPGETKRFEQLVMRSIEQMEYKLSKGKKK